MLDLEGKKVLKNMIISSYVTYKINSEVLRKKALDFSRSEKGVTAVEYAIVVAGVAAIVLAVFGTDGPVNEMLKSTFTTLKTRVSTLMGGSSGGGSGGGSS